MLSRFCDASVPLVHMRRCGASFLVCFFTHDFERKVDMLVMY